MKLALPDIVLGADGHLYANSAAIPLTERAGRRVMRVVALTPREEGRVRRRINESTGDLLAFLPSERRGAR
jgi:hypothetical protein